MLNKTLIATSVIALTILVSAFFVVRWFQSEWTQWERFAEVFIQSDGRVVDITTGARSTSEGQSYGLFFALVANDPTRFQKILDWTQANLAKGDLTQNLSAWLWGKNETGEWGILDPNAASDADMWIAYSLLEAGRLWERPDYISLGNQQLALIWNNEVLERNESYFLLPAPAGFVSDNGDVRLNPSYTAEFQLRYFSFIDGQTDWGQLLRATRAQIALASTQGIPPDWYVITQDGRVVPDAQTNGVSSYDAIRVYMWSGMTSDATIKPIEFKALNDYFKVEKSIPESMSSISGEASGNAPPGFYAALLPYFAAMSEDVALETMRKRLISNKSYGLLGDPPRYYDQVLMLFGEGWDRRRYCFDERGQLLTRWNWQRCSY